MFKKKDINVEIKVSWLIIVSFLTLTNSIKTGTVQQLTAYGEKCSDSCDQRGFPYSWCHKQFSHNGTWRDRDYCSPRARVTRYQEPCLNACRRHNGKRFFWCNTHRTIRGIWDYCSPFPSDNCMWSSWSKWKGCTSKCGEGLTKTRQRVHQGENGNLNDCSGEIEEAIENCNLPPCPNGVSVNSTSPPRSSSTWPTVSNWITETKPITTCRWREWSPWSKCSVSCGSGGLQHRKRVLKNVTSSSGKVVPVQTAILLCRSGSMETLRCRADPCSVPTDPIYFETSTNPTTLTTSPSFNNEVEEQDDDDNNYDDGDNYNDDDLIFLGELKQLAHEVSGKFYRVSDESHKIIVRNFTYDGQGPDAFFITGTSGSGPHDKKAALGKRIILVHPFNGTFYDYEDQNVPRLKASTWDNGNFVLNLPIDIKVDQLKWISVYCRLFSVNFGHATLLTKSEFLLPTPNPVIPTSIPIRTISTKESLLSIPQEEPRSLGRSLNHFNKKQKSNNNDVFTVVRVSSSVSQVRPTFNVNTKPTFLGPLSKFPDNKTLSITNSLLKKIHKAINKVTNKPTSTTQRSTSQTATLSSFDVNKEPLFAESINRVPNTKTSSVTISTNKKLHKVINKFSHRPKSITQKSNSQTATSFSFEVNTKPLFAKPLSQLPDLKFQPVTKNSLENIYKSIGKVAIEPISPPHKSINKLTLKPTSPLFQQQHILSHIEKNNSIISKIPPRATLDFIPIPIRKPENDTFKRTTTTTTTKTTTQQHFHETTMTTTPIITNFVTIRSQKILLKTRDSFNSDKNKELNRSPIVFKKILPKKLAVTTKSTVTVANSTVPIEADTLVKNVTDKSITFSKTSESSTPSLVTVTTTPLTRAQKTIKLLNNKDKDESETKATKKLSFRERLRNRFKAVINRKRPSLTTRLTTTSVSSSTSPSPTNKRFSPTPPETTNKPDDDDDSNIVDNRSLSRFKSIDLAIKKIFAKRRPSSFLKRGRSTTTSQATTSAKSIFVKTKPLTKQPDSTRSSRILEATTSITKTPRSDSTHILSTRSSHILEKTSSSTIKSTTSRHIISTRSNHLEQLLLDRTTTFTPLRLSSANEIEISDANEIVQDNVDFKKRRKLKNTKTKSVFFLNNLHNDSWIISSTKSPIKNNVFITPVPDFNDVNIYDPCESDDSCGPNAICTPRNSEPECTCPLGFTGIPRNGNPDPSHGCVRTPIACSPKGSNRRQCPNDHTCVRDLCLPKCTQDASCSLGERCVNNTCIKICFYDAHCLAGEFCDKSAAEKNGQSNGVCITGCNKDTNCPFGQICINNSTLNENRCEDGCHFNNDCDFHTACLGGQCSNPCEVFDECGTNAVCHVVSHAATCRCPRGYRELSSPYVACVPDGMNLADIACLRDSDCPRGERCRDWKCY